MTICGQARRRRPPKKKKGNVRVATTKASKIDMSIARVAVKAQGHPKLTEFEKRPVNYDLTETELPILFISSVFSALVGGQKVL